LRPVHGRRWSGEALCGSILLLALGLGEALPGQIRPKSWSIDVSLSRLTVNVLPAGLLSSALHPHHFQPEDWSGEISLDPDQPGSVRVEVRIGADSLRDHQAKLSAKDIDKIDRRVRSAEILDAARFPRIVFEARQFEAADPRSEASDEARGTLAGTLTLHGQSRPLKFPVQGRLAGRRLEASTTLTFRQSDFGIKPYGTALGTVAVRDEVTIEIALVALARN
jgi:polyisoprenoid-binding protein YceI